jgi:hypothetical protein
MINNTEVEISFQKANAICQRLLPIGDHVFDCMDKLTQAGFVAWRPYYDFVESFAADADDADVHHKYLVESAKNVLARPWALLGHGQFTPVYTSPFIQTLIEARDARNGVSEHGLVAKYGGVEAAWRREVDPCLSQQVKTSLIDKKGYSQRWLLMQAKQQKQFELEVQKFGAGVSASFPFGPKGRRDCFVALMKQHAECRGFTYDRQKSTANFPVFTKPLSAEWDICWVVEKIKEFASGPIFGYFMPEVQIRKSQVLGPRSKAPSGEVIDIRYQNIVPGFSNAYLKFHSLRELEVVVLAHLHFYQLVAPAIEKGVQEALVREG